MASILNKYISKHRSITELHDELKKLMKEYKSLTTRDLFIYASDFVKGANPNINISLCQDDFYIFQDMLREENFSTIDVYLETPGGSGESAEEIAKFLHNKFKEVNFVIAGEAKSAGTILTLSGDNILMTETGSLGPIDAQIKIGRSVVSAYDYKNWIDEKRFEAQKYNRLNPLDAIIVSQISPGEIKKVINALEFAKDLVIDWLVTYKFKNWTTTETRKIEVTDEIKKERATEVANELTNQTKLRTHGRSLKIDDLRKWLKIEKIDDDKKLSEIVYSIKTVIRLIFDQSSTFKLFLCGDNKIMRTFAASNQPIGLPPVGQKAKTPKNIEIALNCPKCGQEHKIIAYLNKDYKPQHNTKSNVTDKDTFICNNCGFELDLKPIKNDLELKLKTKIFF
jgi:predicted RNA-binding Zn-ribbon protein involved in translation (DUF1610 family)